MASRPIFIAEPDGPTLVRKVNIEFTWFPGMYPASRKKSMHSLHEAARKDSCRKQILEVSRMSEEDLGQNLSAFKLKVDVSNRCRKVPLECVFQASKVFEKGGPFEDLLDKNPVGAKRDLRLQESGPLIRFYYEDKEWDKDPKTFFYNWIYMKALHQHGDLASKVKDYEIFTDISFNPKKSYNCQAEAVARYVALTRRNEIDEMLNFPDKLKKRMEMEMEMEEECHNGGKQGKLNLTPKP